MFPFRLVKAVKRQLQRHAWPILLSEARKAWRDARDHFPQRLAQRTRISLRTTAADPYGTVLLSYVIDPFLHPARVDGTADTRYWESQELAQTWLDLGYDFNVIAHFNTELRPERQYTAVIDVAPKLERLTRLC